MTAAAIAYVLALGLVRLLASPQLAALVLDVPNERSLHERPVPRTGGVGLMLAVALTVLAFPLVPLPLIVPALGLAALFLVDDVRGLSVPVRFAAQFAAAIAFLAWSGPYPWLLWPLLAIGIVWSANLYNFMDGSNGLAGGMAVIGFGALGLVASLADADDVALIACIVAGASAGFLMWNFDPARIFLGDAGSIPLGFLASATGIYGWQREVWPFWLPALVFSPFIVDATITLLRRVASGEKPWQAHRDHHYQRMIRSGWSHRRLALAAYALMLAVAADAVALRDSATATVIIHAAFWLSVYTALALMIGRRWSERKATSA